MAARDFFCSTESVDKNFRYGAPDLQGSRKGGILNFFINIFWVWDLVVVTLCGISASHERGGCMFGAKLQRLV